MVGGEDRGCRGHGGGGGIEVVGAMGGRDTEDAGVEGRGRGRGRAGRGNAGVRAGMGAGSGRGSHTTLPYFLVFLATMTINGAFCLRFYLSFLDLGS